MSIQSEITRLMSAKADLKSAIEGKGVPVPSATKLDGYASLVGSITGGGTPTLQSKSVAFTPAETIQTSTVTADGGYDGLSTVNVSVDAIPSAYVIPSGSLSISANGTYNVEAFARAEVMVSGGGGNSKENEIIYRTISGEYTNNEIDRIGKYAFASCASLITVSFPNVSYIDSSAFTYCSKMTTASFPIASYIGSCAFSQCFELISLYIPNASYIESSCFYNCTKISAISLPNVSSVGAYAFGYCFKLTTVNFSQASFIGSYAFYNCSQLTTVNFPQASLIGSSAFANCSSLTTTNFPKVTSIGNSAFQYCSSLTTVNFPQVTFIWSNAFTYCYKLTTVIFNNTSTTGGTIYSYAFRSCYHLTSLYLLASTLYRLSVTNAFTSTPISNYTTSTGGVQGSIFVPESLYSTYKSSTNWATYADRFASLTDAQISNVLTYGTHNPT